MPGAAGAELHSRAFPLANHGTSWLGVGPGSVKLENLFRGAELAPLVLEIVEALSTRQSSAPFLVAKLFGFFRIELLAFGVVGDFVDIPGRPFRDDLLA